MLMDIKYRWQDKALRYAEKLGITLDEKMIPRWFKVFKQAENGRKTNNLETAYSYLIDHPKPFTNEAKIKMFFYVYEHGLKY